MYYSAITMIKKLNIYLFIFICISAIYGCKKDKQSHPEVLTLPIEATSPTKVTFKGTIVNKGTFAISDHGFIYGDNPSLSDTYGTRVSLGSDVTEGSISKLVTNVKISNGARTLYARAYLTNTNGTVFGQITSVEMPAITAYGMTPGSAKAGDQVVLNGNFFSLSKEEVSVTFGNIQAVIVEVSSTKITVVVPAGIISNYGNQVSVSLSAGGQNLNISYSFTVLPNVKGFSPNSGPAGTTITLTGDNLPNYYNSNLKLYFGTVQATITGYDQNAVYAVVPGNLTNVKSVIAVEMNGVKTDLPGDFTLTAPTITSLSPAKGLPGSSFSIFGTNFPTNQYYSNGNLSVTIGNVQANVYTTSSSQLDVTIPNNLPAGDHKVKIHTGPFDIEAPQLLKVQELSISSFSPLSGGTGKEVILKGVFGLNQSYEVYFGTVLTYATAESATTMRVYVPSGTNAGNVKISIKNGSQRAEAADDFEVLAPSITSFSPSSGVPGTVVTIKGNGFNTNSYYNSVSFGTIATSIISASDSQITVLVPSNTSLGAMKITVVSNGQTIVSASNFTVTN